MHAACHTCTELANQLKFFPPLRYDDAVHDHIPGLELGGIGHTSPGVLHRAGRSSSAVCGDSNFCDPQCSYRGFLLLVGTKR